MNPDELADFIRRAHDPILERNDVIRLLMEAVSHDHLRAHDAMKALHEWDAANAPQIIERHAS